MATSLPNYIFELVSSNIFATTKLILENALKNRFIGFRGEMELLKLFAPKQSKVFEGGYILPLRSHKRTLNAPIYLTIADKPFYDYLEIYKILDKCNFSKLIYIEYNSKVKMDIWGKTKFHFSDIEFPMPSIRIYDFQDNYFHDLGPDIKSVLNLFTPTAKYVQKPVVDLERKEFIMNYLNPYNEFELQNLYVSRLIFDGYIGFNYFKGIPSDIDYIIKSEQRNYCFFEIKEKDLSKTEPLGFGIDVQRLYDCLNIARRVNIPYYYVVRKVDNQKDRNFLAWKYIDFEEFYGKTDKSKIKEGGRGMNTIEKGLNDNPTLLVDEQFFKDLL